MKKKNNRVSIAWVAYQRRVESLAKYYDLDIYYHHYNWEEKFKYYKPISYLFKFIQTFITLFKTNAKIIFIQLPPTFPLYALIVYCRLKKAIYIADCHNTTFYDGPWIKFPFAKKMLRNSMTVLVHNEDIMDKVKDWGLPVFLLRDPIPQLSVNEDVKRVGKIEIKEDKYVIIPGSFAEDEPLQELFDAIKLLPDILFVSTWFKERMPREDQKNVPANLYLTGFLKEQEFTALYAHASAAIVLTTREGTQPSGAAEAISMEIPLVISDIGTTRKLYSEAAIFAKSDGLSIAEGVKYALNNQEELRTRMHTLKQKLSVQNNDQLLLFKKRLDAYTNKKL